MNWGDRPGYVVPTICQTGLEGLPGTTFFLFWPLFSMGAIDHVILPVFGIAGGLITLAFLGSTWDQARSCHGLASAARIGADLSMAGQVFLLIAAWYLCGLLGAPT